MNEPKQFSIITFISKYWFLIIFIGAIIATWTTLNNRTEANSNSITALTQRLEKGEQLTATVNIQLGQIQTDLQWIKAKLK